MAPICRASPTGSAADRGVELALRRLCRADFAMLGHWLAQPHVARWWNHGASPQAVEADFGAVIDGDDPSDVFIASERGRPFGLVQRYTFADNPEYMVDLSNILAVPSAALSMDYFVGETEALRGGFGTAMLHAALRSAWSDYPSAPAVIVPVVAANTASWRTLERAGFRRVGQGPLEPDNPTDDRLHYVYRTHRPKETCPS